MTTLSAIVLTGCWLQHEYYKFPFWCQINAQSWGCAFIRHISVSTTWRRLAFHVCPVYVAPPVCLQNRQSNIQTLTSSYTLSFRSKSPTFLGSTWTWTCCRDKTKRWFSTEVPLSPRSDRVGLLRESVHDASTTETLFADIYRHIKTNTTCCSKLQFNPARGLTGKNDFKRQRMISRLCVQLCQLPGSLRTLQPLAFSLMGTTGSPESCLQ